MSQKVLLSVLIVLVVAFLGGVGYIVMQRQATETALTPSTVTTSTPTPDNDSVESIENDINSVVIDETDTDLQTLETQLNQL